MDGRRLGLGCHVIHLATPERAAIAAMLWLPHDEKLLEHIVYTAIEIARIRDAEV